jgi:hypothetical protein
MFEEPLILVLSYLALVAVPDGLQVVDQLSVQLDRVGDEERVLTEDFLDLLLSSELARLRLQLENDLSTPGEVKVVDSRDLELSGAI